MRKTVMFSAILLGIFLTGTIAVKAQKSEAALASIDYEFVHVNDTNNRDKPLKLNMRVYLGLEEAIISTIPWLKQGKEWRPGYGK